MGVEKQGGEEIPYEGKKSVKKKGGQITPRLFENALRNHIILYLPKLYTICKNMYIHMYTYACIYIYSILKKVKLLRQTMFPRTIE